MRWHAVHSFDTHMLEGQTSNRVPKRVFMLPQCQVAEQDHNISRGVALLLAAQRLQGVRAKHRLGQRRLGRRARDTSDASHLCNHRAFQWRLD